MYLLPWKSPSEFFECLSCVHTFRDRSLRNNLCAGSFLRSHLQSGKPKGCPQVQAFFLTEAQRTNSSCGLHGASMRSELPFYHGGQGGWQGVRTRYFCPRLGLGWADGPVDRRQGTGKPLPALIWAFPNIECLLRIKTELFLEGVAVGVGGWGGQGVGN